MDALIIDGNGEIPNILIDPKNNSIRIEGISRPENVLGLYKQIMNWIEANKSSFNGDLICDFYFVYINTSSQKMIFELLNKLKNIVQHNIILNWSYREKDIFMKELGEEIADMLKIKVILIPVI